MIFFPESSKENENQENKNKLELQQALFNAFFAAADTGLVIFDRQLQYVYINEALAKLDGLSVQDHTGKSIREVIPQLASTIEPMFQNVLDTGKPLLDFEIMGETAQKPGVIRYWSASYYPLLDQQGVVIGVGGVVNEITERKLAEQALQQKEAEYRTIFESVNDGIGICDLETGEIIATNPAYARIHGYTVEEFNQLAPGSYIHPDSHYLFAEFLDTVKAGKEYSCQAVDIRKDGTSFDLEVTAVPYRQNNKLYALSVVRDISDRQKAKLELRQSEERYRFLIKATSQIIWTTEADGTTTGSSDWSAFTGQTEAEMAGTGWANAIHPDDQAHTTQAWLKALQTKGLYETEARIRAADGSYRYFAIKGVPVLNEDSSIREWVGTCTDIEDQKQAELALQQSEERYRSLITATSQVIWTTDADGRVRDMPNWRDLTGQTVAEVVGFGWLDAIHPEDRERTGKVWMHSVETKTLYEIEYRIRTKDGSYRYFVARGVPVLATDGSIREWIGTCTDIHDRKVAEQKVSQTLELLDLASDSIIIRDMSDRIIYWNRGAEILYGWQREEVVGQYIHSFLQTTFPKPLEDVLVEFFQQGSWEGELQHITRENHQIIVSSRWTLQRDQFGQPLAQLEINNDITQMKQAQMALAKAKDAAETANRAKSEFLANMSHELRTPLNGILGYAQILQRSKELNTEDKSRIDVIYQCGNHLLTLINDILDLSKIEAQKVELMPTDFHLPAFLQGVAEMCRVRAELKGIQFDYKFAPELPIGIRADEKRLRQVLINLLSNAIKFTDTGSVTFTISYASQGKIRFELRDTGTGIAQEQLQAIFQPFEQVGDTRRQTEGTGLGLAISKKIVELMGSQIQVQSELGVGSIFWFDVNIPEAREWVKTSQSDRHGQIIGIKDYNPKLLVIDDKWENRSVVNKLLSPIGFDVIEAIDGQEGWQKVVELQPDVVITDLLMPKLNGFELIERIRSSEAFKELVIIVSSASVFEADQHRSLEAGGNDFLPKPLQARDLLEKLQKHLHLEWIYEQETLEQLDTNNIELIAPPVEELENIYELAMKGNFKGIIKQAALLEEKDQKYIPFAQQLHQLAKDFQDEKILTFIQSYK